MIIVFSILFIVSYGFNIFRFSVRLENSFLQILFLISSVLPTVCFMIITKLLSPKFKNLEVILFIINLITALIFGLKFLFLYIVSFVFLIVLALFTEVISTFCTFSILSFFSLVIYWILHLWNKLFPSLYEFNDAQIVYTSLVLYMIIYTIKGVDINKAFLKFIFSEKETLYSKYEQKTLNNHMKLFYFLLFFILNFSGIITSDDGDMINNIFLTGLCTIDISWNKITERYKKAIKK